MLSNVIEVAKENGLEVHLYTSKSEGFLSGISGINYHSNYYIRSRFRIITLFTFFLSQIFLASKLLKWKGEDCLFYINTILPFSAIWMGNWMNKKTVVHVHEHEVSPKILNRFLFKIVRDNASDLITVSKFLSQNPSLSPRISQVIPNCAKIDFIKNSNKNSFPKQGGFRVLMLASLRPYKGIEEFLKLAKIIPELTFDLVLSDQEPEVEDWKKEHQLPPNLKIYPVQNQVISFYSNASLILNLAHPDEWLETFGMTILEGMHFGLPAIVPSKGGVTELVQEGINGYLVDYTELDRIKALIKKLSENEPLWSELSKNAFEKASFYSFGNFKSNLEKILA